jgi:hypothetical protein
VPRLRAWRVAFLGDSVFRGLVEVGGDVEMGCGKPCGGRLPALPQCALASFAQSSQTMALHRSQNRGRPTMGSPQLHASASPLDRMERCMNPWNPYSGAKI